MNKKLFSLVIFFQLFCVLASNAQGKSVADILLGQDTKTDYIGQYKDRHNVKNGMGLLRLKGGGVYAGDFTEGKMGGKGIIISPKKPISNAPGATFYVGSFFNGKKEHKGTLYAANGDIIYQGSFADDKPVGPYPMVNPPITQYFNMMETGEDLFWGEVIKGVPNGLGMMLQADGSVWIGNFKKGKKTGVSITIYGKDAWEIGRWTQGRYSAYNDSQSQNSRKEVYKTVRKQLRQELLFGLLDVATNLIEATANTIEMRSNAKTSYVGNYGTSSVGNSSHSSKSSRSSKTSSSKTSKRKQDCGTSWMSESQIYSDYETQLIRYGNRESNDKDEIRKKMKALRTKWEARGCPFTKSPYE